jgi:serine/threonine protein kinase
MFLFCSYMAPEVMMGAPFNEKADVYSFAIVLWEMLTFTEPFPHHTNVPGFVKAVAHEGEVCKKWRGCFFVDSSVIASCDSAWHASVAGVADAGLVASGVRSAAHVHRDL